MGGLSIFCLAALFFLDLLDLLFDQDAVFG
jgi:hypothetical protein